MKWIVVADVDGYHHSVETFDNYDKAKKRFMYWYGLCHEELYLAEVKEEKE